MRKSLAISIILLLSSWTVSLSQGTDTSYVVVPKVIATEIAKDLVRLDMADSLNTILEERLDVEVRKVSIQEAIISDQRRIIDNKTDQIFLLRQQLDVNADMVEYWEKQYKKQKRQKFLTGGIGLGLIVILGIIAN